MKFILIITFVIGRGIVQSSGSVAMQEFDSHESCNKARKYWISQVESKERTMNDNQYIAMCVKK